MIRRSRPLARFVVLMALTILGLAQPGQAQRTDGPQGLPEPLWWFQFSDDKANSAANGAVHDLTEGLANLLLALDGGRKTSSAVDNELAGKSIDALKGARQSFDQLSHFIGNRKIDIGTIQKIGGGPLYFDLGSYITSAGYTFPTDGKELTTLFEGIIDHMINDLIVLRKYKKGDKFKDTQAAFFDLIVNKILLEKLGAATGVISIAMQ